MTETKLTSWWGIKRDAIATLGEVEFDRRLGIADAAARKIADDPSWFKDDKDREGVFVFVAHRLRSLAVQLGEKAFAKFEKMDHDTLGCAVVKMIESGVMI